MDYNSPAAAAHYAAPPTSSSALAAAPHPSYYPAAAVYSHPAVAPSSAVSGYSYNPPASSAAAAADVYQYQHQPTSSSAAADAYLYQQLPASAAANEAYQQYQQQPTVAEYSQYQQPAATYSAAAVGYQYPAATSSASTAKYFGRTPATAASNPRNRPGLGFKEHDLAERKLKMMKGGVKSESVRVCATCNVVCNSDKVFESHITSIKHIAKVSGKPVSGIIGPNPKKKKKKAQTLNSVPKLAQPVFCEICKISCNDLEMYNKHVAGKKHNKNIKNANISYTSTNIDTSSTKLIQFVLASNSSDINNNINSNNCLSEVRNMAHNSVQKVVQSVYCDICKITCDTQEVFNIHLIGKKHNKKVTSQIMAAAALAAANNNNNTNLNISTNNNVSNNEIRNNNKRKVATKEELEVKKRKMIENGTNLECVKVCEICNVVCSSLMVFDLHVKGKMHLSMITKLEKNREIEAPKLEGNLAGNLEEMEENLAPKLDGN